MNDIVNDTVAALLANRKTVEMILPVVALLFSSVLAFLSIWAYGRQSRMSIMPMPYLRLSNYINLLAVELVNGGVGTFVIESIVVTPDSERARRISRRFVYPLWRFVFPIHWCPRLDEARLREALRARLRTGEFGSLFECVADCKVKTWNEFLAMAERRPVSPSDPVPLLMLTGRPTTEPGRKTEFEEERDGVRLALKRMHVVVTGHDIHRNRFAATRSLDWFENPPIASSERGPKGM